MQPLGRDVGEVRRQERERDLDLGVVDAAADSLDDGGDDDADQRSRRRSSSTNARPRAPTEKWPVFAAVSAIENATRPTPSLTRLSASRIVRSRSGAEVRPITRGRADRVGRAEDRAEQERTARAERGDDAQTMPATAKIVAAVRPDREQEDRDPVPAHLERRGQERRRVEERRQEAVEDDLRRQPDRLDAGREADHEPGEHEVARRRHARPARERDARDHGDRDGEPDENLGGHHPIVLCPSGP